MRGMNQYNTTAEWEIFLQDSQLESWIATMESLVKDVVLPRTKPDVEAALALLLERHMPSELVVGVEKNLNGEARSSVHDSIEIHKAQWVIGQAMATLFLDSSENALGLLFMVPDWNCWEGFCTRLSKELNNVDRASHFGRRFMEAIADLEANPRGYCMFRSDEQRFLQMNEVWKKESSLSAVWNPTYGWSYVTMHLPASSTLRVLLPNFPQVLVNVLEQISYPPIVKDILWVCSSIEASQVLLRNATSCMTLDSEGKPSWNRKLLAPLLLEWCVTYGTHALEKGVRSGSTAVDEAQAQLTRQYADMVAALMKREDKYFLGKAFLAEILTRRVHRHKVKRDPQAHSLLLLSNALKEALSFPSGDLPDTLFSDTFCVGEEEVAAQAGFFTQTGIPFSQHSGLHLTSLLALIERTPELTEDYAQLFLRFFSILLCFKDAGLYTSEHSDFPDVRHEKMAQVYAATTDPQMNWQGTWRQLSGVRYKLRAFLFNEASNEQRYVLNFVLICGVCAYKILELQNKCIESHALRHTVSQSIADYSHWDWVQERFFAKLQLLIENDDNE